MTRFPFLSTAQWLVVLRVVLGLYMMAHGVMRVAVGTVGNFGDFLASQGLPAGLVVAWGITITEIVGGATLASGRFVRPLAAVFAFEHVMGILLVHAPRGWFTVGHQSGGAEYSVLLLLCFLLTASTATRPSANNNTRSMVLLALLCIPSALFAQAPRDAERSRWSIEAVALGGPGALVGAGVAFAVLPTTPFRLSLEATVLANMWEDRDVAPCPMPPTPCTAPSKPPYIADARTLALRGDYPLGARWRVVGSTGIVAGEWRRPQSSSSAVFDLGVGVARESRVAGHAFEVRAHQIFTDAYPTYAARIALRLRF